MSDERRIAPRATANIAVKWEGIAGSDAGTVSDLSVDGCFILCSGRVMAHEQVKLEFNFPDFKSLPFFGEVVYQIDEIGFAVQFVDPTAAQVEFLRRLIAANQKADSPDA